MVGMPGTCLLTNSICLQAVRSKLSDVGSLAAAFLSDNLLGGLGAIELKVLLDIALENQRPEGFTACEIGAACGSFTRQASQLHRIPNFLCLSHILKLVL